MVKIKICGIKTLPEALSAIEAGADYLGFNFYPKSVRFIEHQKFIRIGTDLRQDHPSIKLVGVFVNSSSQEIKTLLDTGILDLAQLHGDESPEFCATFGNKAYKAFRGVPGSEADVYVHNRAPALMVDAKVSGAFGGTGSTADWSEAESLAARYPLFLAGGLNPENVIAAIRQVNPWGVDVASGVESGPGIKDPHKMIAFINAVHSTDGEDRLRIRPESSRRNHDDNIIAS